MQDELRACCNDNDNMLGNMCGGRNCCSNDTEILIFLLIFLLLFTNFGCCCR